MLSKIMSFFRVQNEVKMSRNWVLPEGVKMEQMTLRRPNDLQNPVGETLKKKSLAGGSLGEFGRVGILEIEGVYFTLREETHRRFVNPGFGHRITPYSHCIAPHSHCICTTHDNTRIRTYPAENEEVVIGQR